MEEPTRKDQGAAPYDLRPTCPEEFKKWPNLWEHLAHLAYSSGKRRRGSSIVFFHGPEGLQGCLSDKETSLVLFRTGKAFTDVLAALEKALATATADWRLSREEQERRRRKGG